MSHTVATRSCSGIGAIGNHYVKRVMTGKLGGRITVRNTSIEMEPQSEPCAPPGAGFTSLCESHRKTGGPSSVKIREIDRPGVLRFRRETKAHEKAARQVSFKTTAYLFGMNQST